jgi:hypothetical protein
MLYTPLDRRGFRMTVMYADRASGSVKPGKTGSISVKALDRPTGLCIMRRLRARHPLRQMRAQTAPETREAVEIEIDDRRRMERQQLRYQIRQVDIGLPERAGMADIRRERSLSRQRRLARSGRAGLSHLGTRF